MMQDTDMIAGTFTRKEWMLIMSALGELKGAFMFEVAKKVEKLLQEPGE